MGLVLVMRQKQAVTATADFGIDNSCSLQEIFAEM